MKRSGFFLILALIFKFGWAEEPEMVQQDVFLAGVPVHATHEGGMAHKFMFISAEEHSGKIVKGAPYSAEAVTERTQTLSDGNRIVQKNSSKVYRDGEGRTRREQQWDAIGSWQASDEPRRTVFIQDPVAGVHYVLEPENQTARKFKVQAEGPHAPGEKIEAGKDVILWEKAASEPQEGAVFEKRVFKHKLQEQNSKSESLGRQTIGGIPVDGTKTTITIPAGEMGNELPIQIVSERWYSPDLQINLMTRHNDPRFGETVYQVTNITRGEPDRSLFELPSDYKVESGPSPHHKIIKKHQ